MSQCFITEYTNTVHKKHMTASPALGVDARSSVVDARSAGVVAVAGARARELVDAFEIDRGRAGVAGEREGARDGAENARAGEGRRRGTGRRTRAGRDDDVGTRDADDDHQRTIELNVDESARGGDGGRERTGGRAERPGDE